MIRRWLASTLVIGAAALSAGCAGALFGLANAPTYFSSLKRLSDQPYGPAPRQRLDVYAPADAHNLPVVVFWFGGGWTTGNRHQYRFVGSALAAHGIVAVLPDYALYPQVKFPEFLNDPVQAVVWVQKHATEFGGDPQRIVLMGHSAGAHMAAFLTFERSLLRDAGANPDWIRGFVGLSGPYTLNPNSADLHAIFAPPYTIADWQPARHIDSKPPPALLFHGTDDKVVEPKQTRELEQALLNAGGQVDVVIVPKRGHVDTVAAFALGARSRAPVIERSVAFVQSVTSSQTGR